MSAKTEKIGVVVSDKMQKASSSRSNHRCGDSVYGKTQKRTSKFVAHDEANDGKVGDEVAIVESRPLSRRKRWIVTRVVRKAVEV